MEPQEALDHVDAAALLWDTLATWGAHVADRTYVAAARAAITALKPLYKKDVWAGLATTDARRALTITRIGLAALRDSANLHILARENDWLDFERSVETAWVLLHDIEGRIEFVLAFVADPAARERLGYVIEHATHIRHLINRAYGPGVYASIELDVFKRICSICRGDPRACTHIPGRFYDGERCFNTISESEVVAVALVDRPHDPRCRIWPWKAFTEEDGKHGFKSVVIATAQSLDDESAGRVLDGRRLQKRRIKVPRRDAT